VRHGEGIHVPVYRTHRCRRRRSRPVAAAYSIITDYFEKKSLARALSVYTLGVTIGSGLAYVIGGWVVTIAMNAGTVVLPLIGEREGWQLTSSSSVYPDCWLLSSFS
jgi:MFS family permease